MPVINRFADLHDEIAGWRRDYHRHPELLYDVHRTAADVAAEAPRLRLRRGGGGHRPHRRRRRRLKGEGGASRPRVIGLRADMDALPIHEESGKPWASETPGKMHACGHDGHTAMLLGAARYLAETRRFAGTAVFIFQPAEEGGAGGRAMVEDGMMDRFGIEEVYGMHNMPGLPLGHFAIRPGALMAATDQFIIEIEGHGGHAAKPARDDRPDRHRRGDRPGAAIDRVAQRRPAAERRRLGHHLQRRRHLQRHPAAREAHRHRPLARPAACAT